MRLAIAAFALGILAFQTLAQVPDRWPALVLAAALALRLVLPRAGALVWLAAGLCWAWWHADRVLGQGLDPALEGEVAVVEGTVAGLPQRLADRLRFELLVVRVTSAQRQWPSPGRIRVDWYGPAPAVAAGERWRLVLRVRQARGFANPGGFDYERWLFQHRIRALAYVLPGSANARLQAAVPWHLHARRERLRRRIEGLLDGAPRRGLVIALALGDRSGIDPGQWRVLRRTGTGHLVAISGLHVGLAAGFAFLLARLVWAAAGAAALAIPAPRVAALAALAAALTYAALAGWSVPTQRAGAAAAVVLLTRLAGRTVAPSRLFALALAAVLLIDPLAVLGAGFWLSFGAVAVILYRYSARAPAVARWRQVLGLHPVIGLGLAPVLALVFGENPLLGPLANLVAVPWMGLVVVPLVLAGTLAAAVADAPAAALLWLAHAALGALWPGLELLAGFDAALWRHTRSGAAVAIPAAVGIALLLAPRGVPGRWTGLLWLLPLLAAPRAERLPDGDFRLTVLDVGQGLAALVETRRHALLFDTGPRFSPQLDAGTAVIVPHLRWRGIRALDAIIVSHADLDHRGGLAGVAAAIEVRRLLSSAPERLGRPAGRCTRGQRWRWDGVDFELLHPPPRPAAAGNDASCVLRVAGAHGAALLPGDIERGAERALLAARAPALAAAVLVVPHHGSATSSTREFVAAVGARYALIPAGYRNRFGFPAPPVSARYRAAGATVLDTGTGGAITVRVGTVPLVAQQHRHRDRRYWRTR